MTREPYLLHHLLEESAERCPENIASTTGKSSITYGDLVDRSRSLAAALTGNGVRRGDRVGILANKGIESIVAVYGVMMAGGVYVPLDVTAPVGRLAFMVEDCEIDVLVSEDRKAKTLRGLADVGTDLRVVIGAGDEQPYPNVSWDQVSGLKPSGSPRQTELDPCYVLYTSGSTGTPKGIVHSHRSALSWANVSSAAYEMTSEDVVSNCGPLHFDQSTLDLFASARAGATTAIVPEDRMKLPASLLSFMREQGMTVLYTVPTTLVQIAASGLLLDYPLPDLRVVLFGGEPMPPKHLRSLMDGWPRAQFVNVYGPTEVNGVTHHRVEDSFQENSEGLPIGEAYENAEVIVVDESGAEVPDGATGELCARTPTMMLGYWGRPDLDRAAYLELDVTGMPARTFYRTGDLGRRSQDGLLHFHGRKDRQVKVRGFRIELDEIESALLSHPDVTEAAVFVDTNETGSWIHATVVSENAELTPRQLTSHLRKDLPPHAVPSTIEIASSMPRTTTGKIDRRALQSVAAAGDESATA